MRSSRPIATALLAVLCWAVIFGPSVAEHVANSANPLLFNDDVRQQVWPFFRYSDGGFTRDYIGGYYLNAFFPAGYRALFTGLAYVVDPVATSKVAPYLLLGVTLGLCALTALRLAGTAALLGCGLLFLSSEVFLERMVGGLPRGFGFPIVALAMYALAAGNPWCAAAAVAAGAFFYPAAAVAPGAALALWLLVLPRRDRERVAHWSVLRRCAFVAGAAAVAGVLVLPGVLSARRYGPLITPDQSRAYPETVGRYAIGDRSQTTLFLPTVGNALSSTLVGKGEPFVASLSVRAGADSRRAAVNMPMNPRANRVLRILMGVAALGSVVLCVRNAAARRLLCLLMAALASFVVAKNFGPYLYLPQRHIGYVVPLLVVVLVPASAAALGTLLPGRAARYAAPALALSVTIAVLLLLGGRVAPKTGLYIELGRNERIYPFLASLPAKALIAGLPDPMMDNVPYVARRQVFLTRETHQVFHARYVGEMRRRMKALIAATFANDYAPLAALRKFHVTHLVVNRIYFGPVRFNYLAPFGPILTKAYAGCAEHGCILAKPVPEAEVFKQGQLVVLDLSKLPAPESGDTQPPS